MADSDNLYKKKEFDAFIKIIDEGQIGHWVDIARALNVSDETIIAWKKLPEAQEAIQRGIDHALQCMQQAGSRDWRMWEAKLKMLGVNPANKAEVKLNSSDPIEMILVESGLRAEIKKGDDNDRQDNELIQSSSES